MSFDTILIANRGEIAVRIIRTAKRLGLRTVAVYSEADRGALHVHHADEAVLLGGEAAADSYLDGGKVIDAALRTGAGAIHPGYGFLSENADFARACAGAGIAFVGPTPEQLEIFGAKHTARDAAAAAGVPMLPGTGLLDDIEDAAQAAESIGYPVMLKATAGGGGIGMQACADAGELRAAWDNVRRLAGANFSSTGVFLERLVTAARHVEVQVFGDGRGTVVDLGDRDCSLQRRNQKVIEESPAPGLPDGIRAEIADAARRLCASVGYRSAGTVEYIYDAARKEAYFLEVNTRLQVEHPVTEQRYGVDLVEWMIRLAQADPALALDVPEPTGAAIEARIYAENPDLDNMPSSGTITAVRFPTDARIDGWIEAGTEVSASYDPMLAKVIVTGSDRADAWARLSDALAETTVQGVATNVGPLRAAAVEPSVLTGDHSTATLAGARSSVPRLEVVRTGMLATVQDWPGRVSYWPVGIPPSGPMDDLSFRLGNRALGNPEGAPGIEITMTGPVLRFHTATRIILTGAPCSLSVDGTDVDQWEPVDVPAGALVEIGTPTTGMRTYLLVEGGLDVLPVMGSVATFTDGQIGGTTGHALRIGDIVEIATPATAHEVTPVPAAARPRFTSHWQIGGLEGPHAAPEFFTEADMEVFYDTDWEVHFNSARSGVRLTGPKPQWARTDGGEAGLHPSNIHDTPYTVGAVDYTGDLPILLGPDGPSLGGFTCPVTVPTGHRWKLGQLRPGDTVRFVPITTGQAEGYLDDPLAVAVADRRRVCDGGILLYDDETPDVPAMTIRRQGDAAVLVEYGPMQLDPVLRLRVHALAQKISEIAGHGEIDGIIELTPGIRSLQVHIDPRVLTVDSLVPLLRDLDFALPSTRHLRVPSRTVHLPLSWDDPATREAIERYMAGVRDDAPWCPWNIEFIRRINGLESVRDVHNVLFEAEYLVLGLGDVYLGAPVATPMDPRHRLVTTKYNPARTWTAQNSVGIGGAYLCIYGMEGPGGYQFVGRTVQVWSTYQQRGSFEPGVPWLLRFFDRITWYEVTTEELAELRADQAAGRLTLRIEEGSFGVQEYDEMLAANASSIEEFRERQQAAFAAERAAWEAAGEFERAEAAAEAAAPAADAADIPEGWSAVEAQFAANVVRLAVAEGDEVVEGQLLVAVEAMKMEAPILAPASGTVESLLVTAGAQVGPGSTIALIRPAEELVPA